MFNSSNQRRKAEEPLIRRFFDKIRHMNHNKGIAPILIVLITAGILAVGGGTYYFWAIKSEKPIFCTQEAKVCLDGSTVGRTGLNCEFAPCPTVTPDENEKYCEKDKDCACGINITTENCFYGNKDQVNTTKQCPDFCGGFAGNLVIKCVNNSCKQITVSK